MSSGLHIKKLTSMMTSCAAFPTASIAHAAKMKTVIEPINPPINTSGMVMSTLFSFTYDIIFTSSIKALNKRKQAKAADPTE